MNVPRPPERYDPRWASDLKRELDIESGLTLKRDSDVEVGAGRLLLRSPDGTVWNVTVDDTGTLSATAL
jgi:hypothetical protein